MMADLQSADVNAEPTIAMDVTTQSPIVLADCLALLRQEKPDLATVAAAWDDLPEAIRAAILALVATAAR